MVGIDPRFRTADCQAVSDFNLTRASDHFDTMSSGSPGGPYKALQPDTISKFFIPTSLTVGVFGKFTALEGVEITKARNCPEFKLPTYGDNPLHAKST